MAKKILFLAATLWSASAFGIGLEREAELRHLLLHDCGSCHGMTLKGGIGPSLLPSSLVGKPDAFLSATILEGRSGTPMPAWRGILSEQETEWLVQLLRHGVERK